MTKLTKCAFWYWRKAVLCPVVLCKILISRLSQQSLIASAQPEGTGIVNIDNTICCDFKKSPKLLLTLSKLSYSTHRIFHPFFSWSPSNVDSPHVIFEAQSRFLPWALVSSSNSNLKFDLFKLHQTKSC